jgi:catechol 2,3-dioxygenase-like lactoylglutathione lyase family enzyme
MIAFNHVSVTAADLDRSLGFYADVVGLQLLGRGETDAEHVRLQTGFPDLRLRWAELSFGRGQVLELFEYLTPRGTPLHARTCDPGCVHFALEVDDLERLYERLVTAGVRTRSKPVSIATGNWQGAKALYALDPDGVTVEFVEAPPAFADGG